MTQRLLVFTLTCAPALLGFHGSPANAQGKPPVTALAFAPAGDRIVAGSQAGIEIRSWPELVLLKRVPSEIQQVHDVAFSRDGQRLAVVGGAPADEGLVELLAWPTTEVLSRQRITEDVLHAVGWAVDDRSVVVAAGDRSVQRIPLSGDQQIQKFNGHSRRVLAALFLPSGEQILSAGRDQSLRVWQADGALVRTLDHHRGDVLDLKLRPTSDQAALPVVASASADRTVRLWQPTIGRMVRFAKLPSVPLALDWTPAGDRLIACCRDGHVRLIDPDSVSVIAAEAVVEGWAYAVACAPGGGSAAVGGEGGSVSVWPLPDESQ